MAADADAAVQSVTLELWNAETDTFICTVEDGETINPALVVGHSVTLVAVPDDPERVGSIRFDLDDGARVRTENVVPYAVFGDRQGDLRGKAIGAGSHTLSVTGYSKKKLRGDEVFAETFSFNVAGDDSGPTIAAGDGLLREGSTATGLAVSASDPSGLATLSVTSGPYTVRDGELHRTTPADYDEGMGGVQHEIVELGATDGFGNISTTRLSIEIENHIDEKEVLSGWISALQYATGEGGGAIRVSDGVAAYEHGTGVPLQRVVPYFANLGVLGVLEADAISHAAQEQMALEWLRWYIDHRDEAANVPFDTWYGMDGAGGTICPVHDDAAQCGFVDAEDSSAALFLVVLERYIAEADDSAIDRDEVRALTDGLLALRDSQDGLFWAKQSYPIKFLMDNVEVVAGLRAIEAIERSVYGDAERADALAGYAAQLEASLYDGRPGGLYDSVSGLFYTYKDGSGARGLPDLGQWYPGMMAQIWPTVFRQGEHTDAYDQVHAAVVEAVGADRLADGDSLALLDVTGTHAPALVYAMQLEGSPYAPALTRSMYDHVAPGYDWPFTVADAGWLLRALDEVEGAGEAGENWAEAHSIDLLV